MSSDQTQYLSASKLESACKRYQDAIDQALAKGKSPEAVLLHEISRQLKQHLLACHDGMLVLPASLQDKATQCLGEIAVMEYKPEAPASGKTPSVNKKTVLSLHAHLLRAISNIPEAVYWMDENGRVIDCNYAEAELFGFDSPDEMIGKDIFDLAKILGWEPHIAEKLRENDLKALRTKQTVSVEEEHISPDGEAKTFLTHKIPFFDKNENPSGIMAMSIDISSIKNKERETAHQLKTILSNLPEAIYLIDREGRGVICNEAEAQLYGFNSPNEMIGKNVHDFANMFNWEHGIAGKLRKNDISIMKTGIPQIIEEEHITAQGELKVVQTHKAPYRDSDGKIMGVLGISFDITERKKMEQRLKAASEAKTEMLKNFRHELRTPLAGTLGSMESILEDIQLLKNGKSVDFEQIEMLAKNSLESSNSLMQFVDDIIETIKVYDGNVTLSHRKFSLKDQLDCVKNFNAPAAKQKNIELLSEHDAKIPKYFLGDDVILRRIIQELVVNAVKFTEIGQITVETKLLGKQDRKATIQLIVKDTGAGMNEETQNKIFDFFHRGTPAYESKYRGIGSGLFRTKAYIEKMDGTIVLDSSPGQGTTITCKIPFIIATNQDDYDVHWAPPVKSDTKQPINRVMAATRILLVEDDKKAALGAKATLSRLNCTIEVAETGNEAVNLATNNNYDLIYMDIGLPDFSGIEATKKIREHQKKTGRTTPIVALTAHVEGEEKQACLKAGMETVYNKPLDRNMAQDILDAFVHASAEPNPSSGTPLGSGLPSTEKALFELGGHLLFDFENAVRVCGNNREAAIDILKMFIDTWPEELEQLKTAHTQLDWETVEKLAHKAKGAAVYCGIPRMSMACQYMERYKLAGLDKHLEPLYQQLLTVANETIATVNKWLVEQQSQ